MTLIRLFFSSEDLTIWAFNNTASEAWLQDYIGQTGITYPFAFDASGTLFNDYQVGLHFGNIPPAYLIIDQNGTVRYRLDNQYNRFQDMKDSISALLDNEE
jgi:peroxiredoxin